MSDIFIKGAINDPLSVVKKPNQLQHQEHQGKSFGAVLNDAINDVGKLQLQADQAITKMQIQESGSLHEVMIALEKADISFRTMLQVRNKVLDAYQEVMRMSV